MASVSAGSAATLKPIGDQTLTFGGYLFEQTHYDAEGNYAWHYVIEEYNGPGVLVFDTRGITAYSPVLLDLGYGYAWNHEIGNRKTPKNMGVFLQWFEEANPTNWGYTHTKISDLEAGLDVTGLVQSVSGNIVFSFDIYSTEFGSAFLIYNKPVLSIAAVPLPAGISLLALSIFLLVGAGMVRRKKQVMA